MDLFNDQVELPYNILPKDGTVLYYGKVIPRLEADDYFKKLMDRIVWKFDEAVVYGKRIQTKRKVAWYGDLPFSYTYSNIKKTALPWIPELLELKSTVSEKTGETYNSCLLNLYHDGSEGMAWHSDGETDLKKNGAIASLSFGAARKFAFKHKNSHEKIGVVLEHGSLLVMKGTTQTHWLHRLPPTKLVDRPRINLTFRSIVENATKPQLEIQKTLPS